MRKRIIANEVARRSGISQKQALIVINHFLDVVAENLQNEVDVTLNNFGWFQIQELKEWEFYNPITGERAIVPRKKRVKFVPSKKLKIREIKNNQHE